jgi:hypothetical protein
MKHVSFSSFLVFYADVPSFFSFGAILRKEILFEIRNLYKACSILIFPHYLCRSVPSLVSFGAVIRVQLIPISLVCYTLN